jgi:hypothetical protein
MGVFGSGITVSNSFRNLAKTSGLLMRWKESTESIRAVVSPPAPMRMFPSSARRSSVFSCGGRLLSRSVWKIVLCDFESSS